MEQTNRKVGEYELDNITISNFRGNAVDIKVSMIDFNIQTDIFNTTMHGELRIKDSGDFQQNLPLIGEEILKLEFKKEGVSKKIKLLFYVYSLVDKIKRSEDAFEYVLNFCSIELLLNRGTFISESFTNIESKDMVKKLLTRLTKKDIDIEDTSAKINYIAPNITPFEIINYLTSRTISKNYPNCGSFVFYEDFTGFHFRTLDSMIKSKIKAKYNFSHKTLITNDINNELYSITEWKIDQHYDILDNLNKGGYGITTKVLDPFTRKYDSKTFNMVAKDTYDKISRIDDDYKNALHDENTFLFSNAANNITKFRLSYNDFNKEHIIGQRYVQLNQISNNYRLILKIPGNLEITVGDIINLDYTNFSSDSDKKYTDLYLSGKYLITAIKYHCTNTEFHMVLEVTKDSYNSNHEEHDRIPLIA